jgi:hypothetical protein
MINNVFENLSVEHQRKLSEDAERYIVNDKKKK